MRLSLLTTAETFPGTEGGELSREMLARPGVPSFVLGAQLIASLP